jgi:hypothetical protein
MAEHKHGEMDIEVQKETFDGFIKFSTYVVYVVIAILIFMALVNS